MSANLSLNQWPDKGARFVNESDAAIWSAPHKDKPFQQSGLPNLLRLIQPRPRDEPTIIRYLLDLCVPGICARSHCCCARVRRHRHLDTSEAGCETDIGRNRPHGAPQRRQSIAPPGAGHSGADSLCNRTHARLRQPCHAGRTPASAYSSSLLRRDAPPRGGPRDAGTCSSQR